MGTGNGSPQGDSRTPSAQPQVPASPRTASLLNTAEGRALLQEYPNMPAQVQIPPNFNPPSASNGRRAHFPVSPPPNATSSQYGSEFQQPRSSPPSQNNAQAANGQHPNGAQRVMMQSPSMSPKIQHLLNTAAPASPRANGAATAQQMQRQPTTSGAGSVNPSARPHTPSHVGPYSPPRTPLSPYAPRLATPFTSPPSQNGNGRKRTIQDASEEAALMRKRQAIPSAQGTGTQRYQPVGQQPQQQVQAPDPSALKQGPNEHSYEALFKRQRALNEQHLAQKTEVLRMAELNRQEEARRQQAQHNELLRLADIKRQQEIRRQAALDNEEREHERLRQEAKLERERRDKRKAVLKADPNSNYHSLWECLEYWPLRRGQRPEPYLTTLLANRRMPEEDESELGQAIKYAKERWDLFRQFPKDVKRSAEAYRRGVEKRM